MGGGGSKQTTETNIVTDIITNVVAKSVQQCTTTTEIGQRIIVRNSSHVVVSGNTFKQRFQIRAVCKQSQSQIAQLQTEIANQIASQSKQTNQAVLGAVNSLVGEKNRQDVRTAVKTALTNDVLAEVVQKTMDSVTSNQEIIVEGSDNVIIKKNAFDSAGSLITQAAQENVQDLKLVQAMSGNIENDNTQDMRNPISDIINSVMTGVGDIVKSITQSAMFLWLFIIIIVAVVIAFAGRPLLKMACLARPSPFYWIANAFGTCPDEAAKSEDNNVKKILFGIK